MRLEHRDPPSGAVLRRWLDDDVRIAFDGRVLAVDSAVARRAADLHTPRSAPIVDALIGATALVHGMAVVTRNVADFTRFASLEVIDPWRPSAG
jgi:predicted nucleic acid-binding protein